MADKPNQVTVEIFGQTYAVKAGAEPGYVEELARYVDAQMREVSRSAGPVDTVRIAVLAALNIADEVLRLRGASHEAEDTAGKKAAALARELASVLEE